MTRSITHDDARLARLAADVVQIQIDVRELAHTATNMQQSLALLHGLLTRLDERMEHLIDQNSRIVDAYIAQQQP